MNTSAKVPDLQDMAFEVFYEDLLSKSTPSTVGFVRACIEQQLEGTMRKRIRYCAIYYIKNAFLMIQIPFFISEKSVCVN